MLILSVHVLAKCALNYSLTFSGPPLIAIDSCSWNDPVKKVNTIGDETLPASCWPDPKLMVEQLKEIGVELMVSPYSHSVGKQSKYWDAANAGHYLATDRSGRPAETVGPG